MFLAGYLQAMGQTNHQIKTQLLSDMHLLKSAADIDALCQSFKQRFPPIVRGWLCRYALTLSAAFKDSVNVHLQRLGKQPGEFHPGLAGALTTQYSAYLSHLRRTFLDNTAILSGEAQSAPAIYASVNGAPRTPEAVIARWYRMRGEADRPNSLSAAFAELHGSDIKMRQYSAMLFNRSTAQTNAVAFRETILFNDVCDFIGWCVASSLAKA